MKSLRIVERFVEHMVMCYYDPIQCNWITMNIYVN